MVTSVFLKSDLPQRYYRKLTMRHARKTPETCISNNNSKFMDKRRNTILTQDKIVSLRNLEELAYPVSHGAPVINPSSQI